MTPRLGAMRQHLLPAIRELTNTIPPKRVCEDGYSLRSPIPRMRHAVWRHYPTAAGWFPVEDTLPPKGAFSDDFQRLLELTQFVARHHFIQPRAAWPNPAAALEASSHWERRHGG